MAQPPPPPPHGSSLVFHGFDDLNDSALFDNDHGDLVPVVSDDKYAEELQFQETLMYSLTTSQNSTKGSSSKAESSFYSDVIICEICAETKMSYQMFRIKGCGHSFCTECVTKQVATKIQESIAVVACPALNCQGVLELDACRTILPEEIIGRWDKALCEALFQTAQKFYCPFRDCSASLLDENEGGNNIIREAECPLCHRLFCARCHVPWHPGVECEVFQTLNEDERGREDLLVRELASEENWGRCPQCKFYVEKTEGCLHIVCRCRFEFCYACGGQWTNDHGDCQ